MTKSSVGITVDLGPWESPVGNPDAENSISALPVSAEEAKPTQIDEKQGPWTL